MVRVGQLFWNSIKLSYLYLTEMVILSLLWNIFSFPIITMPASSCGVFYAIKDLKNEKKALKDFWTGFKLYLPRTLILGVMLLFLILVLISSFWYHLNIGNTYSLIFAIFQSTIVVLILFTQLYTLPLMVNYNLKAIKCVKISVYLTLSDISYSLSVFLEVIFVSILLILSVVGFSLLSSVICIFLHCCIIDLIKRLKLDE